MSSAAHQYEDRLLEFAYGELPLHEAEAVEAHLRGCARCADSVAQLRSVRSVMTQLPQVAAPAAGLDSLLAYADQAARRNAELARPRPWWSRFIVPLASVTAVMVVGVVAWRAKDDFSVNPVQVASSMQQERRKAELPAAPRKQDDAYSDSLAAQEPAAVSPPPPAPARPKSLEHKASEEWAGAAGLDDPEGALAESKFKGKLAAPKPSAAPVVKKEAAANQQLGERAASNEEQARGSMGGLSSLRKDMPSNTDAERQAADQFDRSSVSRRAAAPESKKPRARAEEPNAAPQDFAQATRRSSPLNDGAGVSQAMEGNAVNGALRGAGAGGGGPGASADLRELGLSASERSPKKKSGGKSASPVDEDVVTEKVVRAEPAPAPPAMAPQAPPAQAPKGASSMGLGLGRGSGAAGSFGGNTNETEAVIDRKQAADSFQLARRRSVEELNRMLSAARQLQASGDRPAAVRAGLAVLDQGAEGGQRLEALSLLCDAFEGLGDSERAARYCDALVGEFPASAVARQVTERQRSQRRRAEKSEARPAQVPAEQGRQPAKETAPAAVDQLAH